MASVKVYGLRVSVLSNRRFSDLFALEVVSASSRLPFSGTGFPGPLKQQVSGNYCCCFPILCFASQHHASTVQVPCCSSGSSCLSCQHVSQGYAGVDPWLLQGIATWECPALIIRLSQRSSHYTQTLHTHQPALKKSPTDNFFQQFLKVSDFLTGFFPFCLY